MLISLKLCFYSRIDC